MFPDRKQFRNWSYPSKFGFVSFFVGLLVSVLISVLFWLFPDTGKRLVALAAPSGPERLLIGTWRGTTRSTSTAAKLVASGYTRFLETGEYNYTGEVELQGPDDSTLVYAALAAGTWRMVGDRFVITASDIKSVPRTLRQPGRRDIDLTNPLLISLIPPRLLRQLEDVTPRGASQEYAIVELSPTQLRARSTDLRGTLVTYEAVRQ